MTETTQVIGLKLSDIRRYSQLTWTSFRCWQPC